MNLDDSNVSDFFLNQQYFFLSLFERKTKATGHGRRGGPGRTGEDALCQAVPGALCFAQAAPRPGPFAKLVVFGSRSRSRNPKKRKVAELSIYLEPLLLFAVQKKISACGCCIPKKRLETRKTIHDEVVGIWSGANGPLQELFLSKVNLRRTPSGP